MAFQEDAILEYISLLIEIRWFFLRMTFIETFLLQYYLFSGSLFGYASWQIFLRCYLSPIARVIIRHSIFCVLRFQSQIPQMFTVWLFELMVGVTHFGCIGHILSSHWAFMIDTHARTISDDMDSSTFKHSVDCIESLRISTQ